MSSPEREKEKKLLREIDEFNKGEKMALVKKLGKKEAEKRKQKKLKNLKRRKDGKVR